MLTGDGRKYGICNRDIRTRITTVTIRKDNSDSISISNISSRVDGGTLSNISSELLCT